VCHHLLNQLAWNIQRMNMTTGSPNNDEHDIPKVYRDAASKVHSILLFSLGYQKDKENIVTQYS
jgi:hypothetical protein